MLKPPPFQGKGLVMTPGGQALNVTLGSGICKITDIADDYIVCVPPDDEPSPATVEDLHIIYVSISG